jgi:epoxyqueuosine reductase
LIEAEVKLLALRQGAIRAGIACRESFAEAPPSADMGYVAPWAKTVVSFALPLGTEWIQDYFNKVTRMAFKKVVFDFYSKSYQVGSAIEAYLQNAGYKALNIIPNGQYRPDHTYEKVNPDPDLKPPLSLRYMAVGAGVGLFGWSGNVLVPGAWSNVYLGGVLTDAPLQPDPPLEENLCDNCHFCAQVCPTGFIGMNEKAYVRIGGREYVYNRKRSDYRCVIGCGGYTGLSSDGKWSSWSTGKIVLPEDDSLLPKLFAKLRKDPANSMAAKNQKFGSRGVLDRSFEDTNPTCANCSTVCSGPRDHRKALVKSLIHSGIVERDHEGREIVTCRYRLKERE